MKEKLGFGHLGNGITVWDSNRERNGDYLTVAHISEQGVVDYRKCALSDKAKEEIEDKSQRVKDNLK